MKLNHDVVTTPPRHAATVMLLRDGADGPEVFMVRRHGLSVFVLDRQWAGKPFWEMSARFVEWWPTVLGVAELTSKAAYRVPYKRQGQKTLEQIRA